METTGNEVSEEIALRLERVRAVQDRIIYDSSHSVLQYLGNVRIDSAPEPSRWGDIWEPWQGEIVGPLIPALEYMGGIRDEYDGPRCFWYGLPKGHDKTSLIGRLCNWAVAFSQRPLYGVAAASTRDQAHILLDAMASELKLNPWLSDRITMRNRFFSGPGGKLSVVSADAHTQSGIRCDLFILDEITFWERRDLFDILFSGRHKKPRSIFVVITNAGLRGSWQWEIREQARTSPEWHFHETPVGARLASWYRPSDWELIRNTIPQGLSRRVLDNEWIDATESPLLPWDLIQTCAVPESQWRRPSGQNSERYIGVDVGRTQDRTVIWVLEKVGNIVWTRDVKVMQGVTFREQRAVIESYIDRRVVSLMIDQGAIGMQLAEELAQAHPGTVKGVTLSQGRQGQIAMLVKSAFEKQTIRIPDDADTINDFQLIEEQPSNSGTPRVVTRHGATGHGDRFWAMGLALFAVPTYSEVSDGIPSVVRARY